MTIARHYTMETDEDKMDALLCALTALAELVEAIPGCEGVDLLQDIDAPNRIVFIEKWKSVDAHKQGGSKIPKEIMSAVMSALVGRPAAAYLQYLR